MTDELKTAVLSVAQFRAQIESLIKSWKSDSDSAGCVDGDTDKPCEGIQQCADELSQLVARYAEARNIHYESLSQLLAAEFGFVVCDSGCTHGETPACVEEALLMLTEWAEQHREPVTISEELRAKLLASIAESEQLGSPIIAADATWTYRAVAGCAAIACTTRDQHDRRITDFIQLTTSRGRNAVADADLIAGLLARQASAWQPIESAPKDGTKIILGNAKYVHEAYWSKHPIFNGHWSLLGTASFPGEPTHFQPMPLPLAPPVLEDDAHER